MIIYVTFAGDDITESKDGGIIKHEVKKGEGFNTPNDGAMVNSKCKLDQNFEMNWIICNRTVMTSNHSS